MKVVGQRSSNGEYYKKLETTLRDQDEQIVKLTDERDELTKKRDAARKDLEEYLSNLNVE
jgi:septal ring factor EnvC (AmiA/AmiB activator)